MDAMTSPVVWLPSVTALALKYRDFDGRISHYASEHDPVFGSQDNAANASNVLAVIASGAYVASFLATPSGNASQEWLSNKTKGLAVDAVAIGATSLSTASLKDATHRLRPDGSDYFSMPSGHASHAAVSTRLATLNLESIDMPEPARWIADASLYTVSLGTGWARVEAQKHYPSDVLVGFALGNFMAAFFHNTFMGLDNDVQPEVSVGHGNIALGVHIRF